MWKVSVWGIPSTNEPRSVAYFEDEDDANKWPSSLDYPVLIVEIEKLKEFHFVAGEEE